ncbi:MAG: tail fiber domain-containing protein, partial [Bacteroidetes bacterium]|nr:tail fiber domain-containing protein [Bacteroidota bacterium]
ITSTNITNWTTAYGWGDHSLAGYLTSFSETDPQVGSNTINYIPKWDGSALVSGTIYDNGTNVGIGTTNPGSKLHIRLSGTTILDGFRLQTSQTTGEDWYIYMPSTDDLVFRNDVTDVVTIAKNTGNVGIGGDPGGDEKLWVTTDGTDISGIYVDHNKTGSGYAYGIYVDVDATYSGNKYAYGISSNALNNGGSYSTYGLRGYATGTSTGTKYGVYGFTGGTGTRYGVYASGDLAYTGSLIHISDVKFKKNVQSMTGILPKLKQLNAKSYTHSTDSKYKHMNLTKGNHYGLIAQELEQVFPELVIDAVHPGEQDEETGEFIGEEIHYKGVKYMELIPILVQAIQEQQQMIENLQQEIENLKNK